MTDVTPLPFDLPAVAGKKLTVDFAGGNQSSNAGLLALRAAEARLGVCKRIAKAMPDRRDQSRVIHEMTELVMARASAIACGYEDGNDFDRLRHDPMLKIVVGRSPETGAPLASQSTISRLENAPSKTEAARVTGALVDQFTATIAPNTLEVIDMDDTFCAAHGGQQGTFWNAHHDERGFAPIHIHHVASGAPVVAILRPARTPKGTEAATVVKHVTRRIRRHPAWAKTKIVWRGDSHYGRNETMEWCEKTSKNGYIFGFAGNSVLDAMVADAVAHLSFWHAFSSVPKLRCYKTLEYKAQSWPCARKVVARIEVSMQPDPDGGEGAMKQSVDTRYVVTSLDGPPERLYEGVYCQRGQAENMIKLHKVQCNSERTSCHSATANQVRLVFSTAAYWLLRAVRNAVPADDPLAKAEFTTIRERLVKIAARVIEHATRIRIQLPTSCPDADLFRRLVLGLTPFTTSASARLPCPTTS